MFFSEGHYGHFLSPASAHAGWASVWWFPNYGKIQIVIIFKNVETNLMTITYVVVEETVAPVAEGKIKLIGLHYLFLNCNIHVICCLT